MPSERWIACLLAGVLACFAAGREAMAAEGAGERVRLSVLYVGEPQTARTKDFVAFLEKHFTKVAQGEASKFREKDVEGFDVVIVDYGPVVIKNNAIQVPTRPFGNTYSRPTVMVGATAGLVSGGMRLKTGYL